PKSVGLSAKGVFGQGCRRAKRGEPGTPRSERVTAARPAPAPARPATQASPSGPDGAGDSYIRRAGRSLIYCYYGALRAVKLYPVENAAVQKALEELTSLCREIIRTEGELEIRVSGEFMFVNATRLRLDLDNYATFSHLLTLYRSAGVGSH